MTSLRSKDENLALAQENWTKLAIKLSAKVLLYLIPKIALDIFHEGFRRASIEEFYCTSVSRWKHTETFTAETFL